MSEIRQMYREQKSVTAATRLGEWRVAAINFWNTPRERAENGIGTAAVVPLWPMVGTAQRTHVYYYYFVINNAIRRRINCSIEPQPRAVFVENAFVRCTRNAFSSPHCDCTRVTCVFLFASGFWYSENKLERRINWNWYRWKSLWLNGVCVFCRPCITRPVACLHNFVLFIFVFLVSCSPMYIVMLVFPHFLFWCSFPAWFRSTLYARSPSGEIFHDR